MHHQSSLYSSTSLVLIVDSPWLRLRTKVGGWSPYAIATVSLPCRKPVDNILHTDIAAVGGGDHDYLQSRAGSLRHGGAVDAAGIASTPSLVSATSFASSNTICFCEHSTGTLLDQISDSRSSDFHLQRHCQRRGLERLDHRSIARQSYCHARRLFQLYHSPKCVHRRRKDSQSLDLGIIV